MTDPKRCSFCFTVCESGKIIDASIVRNAEDCECAKGCSHGARNVIPV